MTELLNRLRELTPEKRRLLEMRLRATRESGAGALQPRPRTREPLPVSFAQQRMWLVDRMSPGSALYNMADPRRIRGPLDVAALERALNAVRSRHEPLRTTFAERDGEPVQVIHPFVPVPLPVDDLSHVAESEREDEALRRAREDMLAPYNLATGPLFRARLLRLAPDDHALLLSMHHVVSDAWSMGVLASELEALYAAFTAGLPDPLPPLPVQYADFAAWQRERLSGERLATEAAWWRERLAGAPPALTLPADRPRPAAPSGRAGSVVDALSQAATERLKALALAEGATLFAVLLGGFRAVLSRHAGQDDVVVGTTIAGRTRTEIEGLIGFFINTLALRTGLSGDPTFRELVRREKETVLDAFAHQELPFERVVEELRLPRDLSRTPVFQVMCNLRNAPVGNAPAPSLDSEPMRLQAETARFDLSVDAMESEGALVLRLLYAQDLFDEPGAERIHGHLRRLLERAAADPDARLSALAGLDADEHARVVHGWNQTAAPFDADATLHASFEAQADRTPGATAVVDGAGELSFAELDAHANRLARVLRARGVGPETRAGILLERGAEQVVAILAILKAGGAYVPLDPEHPPHRVATVLRDGDVRVVVSRASLRALADGAGVPVVCLERDGAEIAGNSAERVASGAVAENLAYVIYTSGSTGTPRGVGVRHCSVINLLGALRSAVYADVNGPLRVSLNGPITFDTSVKQWIQLLHGHALVTVPRDARYAGATLRDHLRASRVDVLDCTPAQLRLMLEVAESEPLGPSRVLVGGEAIDPALWTELASRTDAAFFNVYGPTETTVDATAVRVAPAHARPTIGGPVANVTAYVLDDGLRPVPAGVAGELFIGGAGLARGYLGRPGLTAERFIPDPFGPPGSRLYRTCDRARWMEGGTLDFLGRVDFQVKVRGFRIELGEIESVLADHPAVRQAVAVVRHEGGEPRIVAYAAAGEGTSADLRAHLREALPPYMLPAAVVTLPALPLTQNGKVDRAALPAPEYSPADAGQAAAPRTPTEERLARIWAEVLGAARVGAEDNFFELGGHSLLAARVIARVREACGAEVPLRALFEAPTVRALGERVDALAGRGSNAPPLVPAPRHRPPPLSFAQERLWFLDQLEPGSPVYNVPHAVELRGELNVAALESALGEIARRHEALRTAFHPGEDGPVQVILPADAFAMRMVDLSALAPGAAEAEAERRIGAEARAPFHLHDGPLWRATLYRLEAARWVLLSVAHHAASDAWSTGILFGELTALYEAFSQGRHSPLPELPIQYADFSAWQRAWLDGEALDAQLAYWRHALADAPATLELPTDWSRPPVQDLRGAVHSFRLTPGAARGARELARSENATLFMVLLAAFQCVLHRWSGQDDVVVGTPILNRPRPELERLIGFFSNTIALRTRFGGAPGFRELLGRVREATLQAYAHQDLPFEKLVDGLGVERSLGHAPLFQVMFTLQNAGPAGLALGDAEVSGWRAELGTSRYDLTVGLAEAGDTIIGGAEYALALWDQATVARMMEQVSELLAAAAASPEVSVSDLPMLPAHELDLVLHGFNATDASPEAATCVHEMFAAQAARTPSAPALEFGGESLSYAEVDARSNRLARRLIALGTGPDARVAICLERSVHLPIAVLAVLRAGAAYVAVDPAYPADRVAYMLDDSRAGILVTTSTLADRVPAGRATVLRVDEDAAAIAAEAAEPVSATVDPDHLAYVLYTSGSTGRPKGAALPHRALVNLLAWQTARWGDGAAARTLQFASLSFDVSFQEIFGTWAAGGTLVLIGDEPRRDAEALLAHLRAERIERLFLPFAALQNLAETAEHADPRLPDLREVVTAGEALRATPQLRAFFAHNPGLRLDNQYGPSETHVVSAHRVSESADAWPLLPPIGGPVRETRLYVLDGGLRPAPIGVAGELWVAGKSLARGYLHRPAMTAEKFIPNPFATRPGERLYRTGDRARWLPNGGLEYMGRTDFQVKIRGFRVEPGEIEAVLGQHPSIREAAVAVRGDGAGRRLVAYVVGVDGLPAATSDLRAHVAASLPEHMVPAAWVTMETLPLTPSGKVDRRALPDPDPAAHSAGRVLPRTPGEELVAGIWERVLGARPGVHDNFFELGGHSLRATQVVSRIRLAFGVDLPLRAIFEAPTVAGMAARAAAARAGSTFAPPALRAARRDRDLPLSFAQQRFWFVERMAGGRSAYHIPVALRLGGELHLDALRTAVQGVVDRHEALRTVFRATGGAPVQVVLPALSIPLPITDLSHLPEDEREARAAETGRDEARVRFDLSEGPLLRARVLHLAENEHVLLLVMHHIVSDGWSMGVLFGDMAELYAAGREGRAPALAPLPVQYADYAVWQRERLDGPALERELAFWRRRLQGAPALPLPTDRPHPPLPTFRGASIPFMLSATESADVAALGRRHGATVFMTLLTAWNVVLARWAGVDDVVVGSPIAGRTPEETERMVGVFLNTLSLRTNLSGDPTFSDLLGQVRQRTLDAYAHQEVPFEKLVEDLKVERSVARHPLFQVMISLQPGGAAEALAFPGLEIVATEPDTGSAKMDLSLSVADDGGTLQGGLKYALDVFDEETAARLVRHFHAVLLAAAAHPERPISALPSMPEEDRALVLEEWNATEATYPIECIHHAVAAQARRTPGAVAVVAEEGSATYGELNARANRIAHRLLTLGAGPEGRVAVLLNRSVDLVAAELGVMKTGAAYLPIDPSAPAERVAFLLRDAGAAAVVTLRAHADRVADVAASVLVLDEADLSSESAADPAVAADPASLAYVIYTSGSTGRPKGVAVPHAGVANLCAWHRHAYAITPGDRTTLVASPAFDASAWETWPTLVAGAELHVVPERLRGDPAGLARWLNTEAVTVCFLPTPACEAVLDAMDQGAPRPAALRALVTGGDALRRRAPEGMRLVNHYGPTENSVASTWAEVPPGLAGLPPIGRPIANHRCYVLDARLHPVPIGVPGELYMAGAGLARGYLHRPATTAEVFIPNPFATGPGERMYATGDRVRWRGDGELEFLGRSDDQVKVRGFRVEPGEVEAALLTHGTVAQAAVVVRGDGGDRGLVAYVQPAPGAAADTAALRAHLKARLPDYMVPGRFVVLGELPLSANGKVDRARLPAPDVGEPRAVSVPQSATERAIAAVWREVLGTGAVGVDDNFFEIGGHSMLVARVQERLAQALGREVSIVDLFQHSTVGALAAHLDPRAAAAEAPPPPAADAADRGASRREMMRRRAR